MTANDTLLECGLRLSIIYLRRPPHDHKRSKDVVDTVACLDMLGMKYLQPTLVLYTGNEVEEYSEYSAPKGRRAIDKAKIVRLRGMRQEQ